MALLLNANDSVSRSYSITKPSPLHPIYPSECGERTANFWNFQPSVEQAGVTLTWNGAKIVFSGICTSSANLTKSITLSAGTYTIKANANRIPIVDDNSCIDVYKASPYLMAKISNRNAINGIANFTLGEETTVSLRIRVQAGVNYDGFTLEPMLNSGSTPLPYEPYGYKIPLTSGDTPVDIYIGDDTLSTEEYVDSGTGKIYRRPNLYDTNATDTSKGYLSKSYLYGNNIGSNPNWFVSEYMPILADTDYIASGLVDAGTLAVIATINVYNSNKQVERYETINSSGDTEINSGVNGAFIRISARNEHKNTVVVKPKNAAPVDPPLPFPALPTTAGSTTISWAGEGLAPSEFDSIQEWVDISTYKRVNGAWVADNSN